VSQLLTEYLRLKDGGKKIKCLTGRHFYQQSKDRQKAGYAA
jgi:hypothetical protein